MNLNPEVIAISSVSSSKLSDILTAINTLTSSRIFLINKNCKFNLQIKYNPPETLGTDRLCSAEGGLYLLKKHDEIKALKENDFFMTVDFGTATTINIIKLPNSFEGGVITPGLRMMSESLHSKTELLPEISFTPVASIIGTTTEENINSGIINSTVGLIERIIRKIRKEFSSEVRKVYITGGNATTIMDNIDFEYFYCRELVLYGIKSVYDLNNPVI